MNILNNGIGNIGYEEVSLYYEDLNEDFVEYILNTSIYYINVTLLANRLIYKDLKSNLLILEL